MTDDHLQRFAAKVVELQEKSRDARARKPDEGLMREVARELGMDEAELVRVKEESHAHKQRARALRSAGNLDEAITELETAWAFNPLDLEVTYMLADGLFTRSQRTKDADEWARAKDLCLQVVEAAPAHSEAPALLNAIKNKDPSRAPTHEVPMAILVGAAVFVLCVLAALLALLL